MEATEVGPQSTYSLAGVRAATTERQEAFIAHATSVLADDERVIAAYLVGGFAVGVADAFSDVDLQVTVADEAVGGLTESWPELARRLAPGGTPLVTIRPFPNVLGGLCITEDWLHFDLVLNPRSAVDPKTVEGMVPLLDKARILPDGPVPRLEREPQVFYPAGAVAMFLYMLGNMVSVVGRDETIPGSNGVIMVRDIALVGLLLAENGIATTREHNAGNPFPFTKRLRRYLTDEQNAVLESLPPLRADWDSIIDCYMALAKAFLPRARRLAEATGTAWPEDYERATVAYFDRMLGTSLGADLGLSAPSAASAPTAEQA